MSNPIFVTLDLIRKEIAAVKRSEKSSYLALADETGFPHKGYMDFVDNRLDPNTGTIRGRAMFPILTSLLHQDNLPVSDYQVAENIRQL